MSHLPWIDLLEQKYQCDVHIVCRGGSIFEAHSLVLGPQSPTIEEAIKQHQQSDGTPTVRFPNFDLDVVSAVIRAFYTGEFVAVEQPSIIIKQEEGQGNEVAERCRPHTMMFCAQAIMLATELGLPGDVIRSRHVTPLMQSTDANHDHVDLPIVVDYTLNKFAHQEQFRIYYPWFSAIYARFPQVRRVLAPVLIKHPNVLEDLCQFLAKKLDEKVNEKRGLKKALDDEAQAALGNPKASIDLTKPRKKVRFDEEVET